MPTYQRGFTLETTAKETTHYCFMHDWTPDHLPRQAHATVIVRPSQHCANSARPVSARRLLTQHATRTPYEVIALAQCARFCLLEECLFFSSRKRVHSRGEKKLRRESKAPTNREAFLMRAIPMCLFVTKSEVPKCTECCLEYMARQEP